MSEKKGICPVCDGTGRKPATEMARNNKWYGYDKVTDTQHCHNCQYKGMFAPPPTGRVELRPDGTPCEHDYELTRVQRYFKEYSCIHGCGNGYVIDSGD